ncbi:heparan-alpha-glucosaminide N-acetyltransferase-like isoform X2 [Tubulanus polymorphus]
MDEARITIIAQHDVPQTLHLFSLSEACYKCQPTQAYYRGSPVIIPAGKTDRIVKIAVNTTFPVELYVLKAGDNTFCSKRYVLYEGWHYNYTISGGAVERCKMMTTLSKVTVDLPVFIALGLMISIAAMWYLCKWLINKQHHYHLMCCLETKLLINSDLGAPKTSSNHEESNGGIITEPRETCTIPSCPTPSLHAQKRLRSLDTFRGISIVIMIFVNYGGGGYWYFKHSAWNGLTVADLVFPWFIFIMGTSTAFSFKGQLRKAIPKWKIFLRIVRRSVTLILLGLLVNTGPKSHDINTMRIPGVLQRFGLVYFFIASVHLIFARVEDRNQNKIWAPMRDIFNFWAEWILYLGVLIAHICLTFLLPVPNCPTGYIGPGGLSENSSYYNCTGGAAGYIDRIVFSVNHIYQHPTSMRIYEGDTPYDPEGLLGVLTSIFLCFLGLQAGKIIMCFQSDRHRLVRWIIWGLITGFIAAVLCRAAQEGGWIPVNKNLWSVSYIMCMACFAFILLAICYVLIDVFQLWSGAPFYYAGMNAILLYLGHEVLNDHFPISFHVADNHGAQLAMDLWGTCFWVLTSCYLYHKKMFYSI